MRLKKNPRFANAPSILFGAALCFTVNSASAATPLLNFEFNEGKGGTTTESASSLIGIFGANYITSDATSPSGAAADKSVGLNLGVDTGTSYLSVDDSVNPMFAFPTNAPFTIEAWVKTDPADARQYEGIGAYGRSYKLGLNNGQLQFTLYGIVDINSGFTVPNDGAWHHVAAVWEPGIGATIYMDSNPAVMAETRVPRAYQNNILTIGAENVSANTFMGSIDRFRIHNAALTANQLDSEATNPKAPLSSTLVAYNFTESAPPYKSATTADRPAVNPSFPIWSTDTPSGKAGDYSLQFGAGKFINVDDSLVKLALDQADPSFTLQSWVKFSGNPAARMCFFFNNAPGGAISFSVSTTRTVFVTTLGVLDANSSAVIPDDGVWHHIAVVHENGKEIRYYVDGILGATRAYTGSVIFTRTATSFFIGAEGATGSLQYTGMLDRLKVSSGVLTAEQLDAWPIPGVQPGSPELSIATMERISWPTMPAGYKLQSSTDLGDTKNWTSVTNTPSLSGGQYFLLVPPSQNKVFYRLMK